jgi:ParB-like chromosome segregation protein Spo0J
MAASVRGFGWITPIVVDEDGVVLAGHGRLQAAHLLGLTGVPTVEVKHLTPARKRAFMLADNRLAELAGWDESLLTIELKELSALNIDFDFEVTGFGTVDLDRLEVPAPVKASKQEVVPELERDCPAVSAPGDLWKLVAASSLMRQRPGGGLVREVAGRSARPDGVHRPPLQRKD